MPFTNDHIHMAVKADVPALTQLINSAYRGKESLAGWTSEADFISGEVRTLPQDVEKSITDPQSVILKYCEKEALLGSVKLERKYNKIFLSMLSVKPTHQANGIGKALMKAADEYTIAQGLSQIYMTVISIREELIEWYKRRGYKDTGQRNIFHEDGVSGKHKIPLQFAVLQKNVD